MLDSRDESPERICATEPVPDRVVIVKSGANLAGLNSINAILKVYPHGQTHQGPAS